MAQRTPTNNTKTLRREPHLMSGHQKRRVPTSATTTGPHPCQTPKLIDLKNPDSRARRRLATTPEQRRQNQRTRSEFDIAPGHQNNRSGFCWLRHFHRPSSLPDPRTVQQRHVGKVPIEPRPTRCRQLYLVHVLMADFEH